MSETSATRTRTARATVNTAPFEASHGRKPKGYGLWFFEPANGGELIGTTATYRDAVAQLPAGHYRALP